MTGVKEEITGIMKLEYNNEKSAYIAIIDFDNLKQGTDLWVFSRIIDSNIDLISILLTPNAPGKVWYTKNFMERSITFYSDQATEVSYRLSGPRFDYKKWPTLSPNQKKGALKVPTIDGIK